MAAQALAECGWIDNDGVDVLMKWELGSANDILPESEMSLKWMLPDDTYSLYGPDDHFVIRLFSCVGVLPSLRPFFFLAHSPALPRYMTNDHVGSPAWLTPSSRLIFWRRSWR